MPTALKTQKDLKKKIASLLYKPIKIKYRGPQGIGNTWQKELGIMISNKPIPDWHGIEVKCLTCEDGNLKRGSDLTLVTKTPDWNLLKKFGITQASFFHQIDYSYLQKGRSLFFTGGLRYIVSPDSRLIDWYVVPRGFPPTEPYSRAPSISGNHVFSWKIEDLLGKVSRLSVTIVKKDGDYPRGTITPLRSYIIDMYQDKFVKLLADGSIRYELRRTPAEGKESIWMQVEKETQNKFPNHPSSDSWEWADTEFIKRRGKWHDHGTGFRLSRSILNSLLSLAGEILPYR